MIHRDRFNFLSSKSISYNSNLLYAQNHHYSLGMLLLNKVFHLLTQNNDPSVIRYYGIVPNYSSAAAQSDDFE